MIKHIIVFKVLKTLLWEGGREERTGVVVFGKVIGGVFLARDELFGVEELTIGAVADLVDDGGFEVDNGSTGDVLARSSFAEGVEGVVGYIEG